MKSRGCAEKKKQAEERKQKERERWPRLLDRMCACSLKAEKPKKAPKLWEQEGDIPRGVDSEALETYWAEGPNPDAVEEELRDACIALEVFVGMDSPPEDKQAPMAYQMQRQVDGMGHGEASGTQRLQELINEFIALRPPAAWMKRYCRVVDTADIGRTK